MQSETARTTAVAARPGRWREARLELQIINNTNIASHANNASHVSHPRIGGAYRGKAKGGEKTRAMVLNVTVAVAMVDPLSVTDDGETVHAVVAGAPVQLHVTVPLKLFAGAAMTVKFAGFPAAIVALEGAADTLKSAVPPPGDNAPSAFSKSSRPWFSPRAGSSAFATAIAFAASVSAIVVFKPLNNAAPPETKGALNEVPHPAEYVLKGYVVTIASPGAATHTMPFP